MHGRFECAWKLTCSEILQLSIFPPMFGQYSLYVHKRLADNNGSRFQLRWSPTICCHLSVVPAVAPLSLLLTFSPRTSPLLLYSNSPQLAIFYVPPDKNTKNKKEMHHSLTFEHLGTVGENSASIESYTTFRLQGIPSTCTKGTVETVLRGTLHLAREATIQIKSLFISPYNRDEAVATLTFDKVPPALSNAAPSSKLEFALPNTQMRTNTFELLLDTHFYGFTTLYCPETSAWKFEYV